MPYFALIIMFYHVKIACYHHVKCALNQKKIVPRDENNGDLTGI